MLVTDSSSPALTATGQIQIVVGASPLTATASGPDTCTVGQPCPVTATVAGGVGADGTYNWNGVINLPPGMSASPNGPNGATFTISGAPFDAGQYVMSGIVTDDESPSQSAGWTFTLTINSLTPRR